MITEVREVVISWQVRELTDCKGHARTLWDTGNSTYFYLSGGYVNVYKFKKSHWAVDRRFMYFTVCKLSHNK